MATKPKLDAMTRTPLSRERVLRAALDLADAVGLESLSMRRLGQELGVEAMSLYNHVASKEDLLDGISDIVVGEIWVPPKGADWKPAMRRRAMSAREMLARHPWAAGLLESRTSTSPARSGYPEAVLGCLLEAGFSPALAVHAFWALDSYVYGSAIQDKSFPFETTEDMTGMAEEVLRGLPVHEYPATRKVILETVLKGGFDFRNEFEFGLDLLLDGLERVRKAG